MSSDADAQDIGLYEACGFGGYSKVTCPDSNTLSKLERRRFCRRCIRGGPSRDAVAVCQRDGLARRGVTVQVAIRPEIINLEARRLEGPVLERLVNAPGLG